MKRMQLKQKIARHVTGKSNNQRYAVFFCGVLCHAMSPLSISAYPTLFHSILSFHKMSSSLILPHINLCFVFYSVPCLLCYSLQSNLLRSIIDYLLILLMKNFYNLISLYLNLKYLHVKSASLLRVVVTTNDSMVCT